MSSFRVRYSSVDFIRNITNAGDMPIWNASALQSIQIDPNSTPTTGDTLVFNGFYWTFGAGGSGGGVTGYTGPTGPQGPTGPAGSGGGGGSLTQDFNAGSSINTGQAVAQITDTNYVVPFGNTFIYNSMQTFGSANSNILSSRLAYDSSSNTGVLLYADASGSRFVQGFSIGNSGLVASTGTPVDITSIVLNQFYYLINSGAGQYAISKHTTTGFAVNETFKIRGLSMNTGTLAITVAGSDVNASTTTTTQANHSICYQSDQGAIVYSFTTATNILVNVLTQSGTTITAGTESTLWAGETASGGINICSNKAGNSQVLFGGPTKIVVGTIDGVARTVTLGTPVSIPSSVTRSYSVSYDNLDSIVALLCSPNSSTIGFEIFTLVGTTLTPTLSVAYASLPNNTSQIIDFYYAGTARNVFVMLQNISPIGTGVYVTEITTDETGLSFTFGTPQQFNTYDYGSALTLPPASVHFVLEHSTIFGSVSNNFILFPLEVNTNQSFGFGVNRQGASSFIGFAQTGVNTGATVTVDVRGGKTSNQTGLIATRNYYLNTDSTLTTTTTSTYAGKALTSTTLLILPIQPA